VEIEDKWFENIIKKISLELDDLIILDSPMFLTTKMNLLNVPENIKTNI
jgi:hypothetical protein